MAATKQGSEMNTAKNLLYGARQMLERGFVGRPIDALGGAILASEIDDFLASEQEHVAWTHSCNALCMDGLELWCDRCPHCCKPRTLSKLLEPANAALRDALDEIHNWLVCADIATVEDMAQSFPRMEQLASKALKLTKEQA